MRYAMAILGWMTLATPAQAQPCPDPPEASEYWARVVGPIVKPCEPVCEGEECYVERTPEMIGFERFDILLWVVAQSDWSTTVEQPNPSFGGTLEGLVNLDQFRRFRLGATATIKGGFWGDKRHGSPNFEAGLTFRATAAAAQDQLIDGGFVVRPAFIYDTENGHTGIRGSAGFGLRVARAFAMELTYEPVFGIDEPFEDVARKQTRMANGVGLQIGLNFCTVIGGCAPSEPHAFIDPTQELAFWSFVGLHKTKFASSTCRAMREALNGYDYAPLAGHDPMEEYLRAVQKIGPKDPIVDALLAKHRELTLVREDARHKARAQLRRDREVKRTVSYAPTPLELASELGCLNGAETAARADAPRQARAR